MSPFKRTSWITWRIYLLALPVNIIVLMASVDHPLNTFDEVLTWGFIALLSHIAIAPFVAVGAFISKEIKSWKFDIFYLILLGAIRGFAIVAAVNVFKLEMAVSTEYKIFNSMLGLPLWFVLISIFFESRKAFQNEFKNLFAQAMDREREQEKRNKLMPESVSDADELIVRLQFLTNSLAVDFQNIIDRKGNLEEYTKQAKRIQSLIDEDIKTTSQDLWNKSEISTPKIPLKSLVRVALFQRPLRIIPVVLISLPYLFVGLHAATNYETTIVQCLLIVLIDFGAFAIFESLYRIGVVSRFIANLSILSFIPIVSIIIQLFLLPKRFAITEDSLKYWIFQVFLSTSFTLMVFVLNSYKIINSHRQEILTTLREHLKDEKLAKKVQEGVQGRNKNELAEYLHGEVQAGLTASSMLLQQAANDGDADLAQEALERAAGLLSQDHTSLYYTRMATPETRLEKIINGWKGIAEIKIDMPDSDLIESSTLRSAVVLIEEAISNSIRHAHAGKISVTGFINEGYLSVSVISDGEPFAKGKNGLGTRLFNDLTEEWSFNREANLNNLTFTLANK